MSETAPHGRIIGVVEDDESLRVAIRSLLLSCGFEVEMFESSEAVLGVARLDLACLIVDVRLPGMSGLDLQRNLVAADRELPIVFISAHEAPVAQQRQALAAGAIAFLRKPFPEDALIGAVHAGLTQRGGGSVRGRGEAK
jgi:FixJ family two-component response regulator